MNGWIHQRTGLHRFQSECAAGLALWMGFLLLLCGMPCVDGTAQAGPHGKLTFLQDMHIPAGTSFGETGRGNGDDDTRSVSASANDLTTIFGGISGIQYHAASQ